MKNLKNLRTFFRLSNAAFGVADAINKDSETVPSEKCLKVRELHRLGLEEVERDEPDKDCLHNILLELETIASKLVIDTSKFERGGIMIDTEKKESDQEKPFPVFWYESQGTWGGVQSLRRLAEFAVYQVENSGIIKNIDDFLDKSRRAPRRAAGEANGLISFGTRREHTGEQTLRMYLQEHGLLDEFLETWNK